MAISHLIASILLLLNRAIIERKVYAIDIMSMYAYNAIHIRSELKCVWRHTKFWEKSVFWKLQRNSYKGSYCEKRRKRVYWIHNLLPGIIFNLVIKQVPISRSHAMHSYSRMIPVSWTCLALLSLNWVSLLQRERLPLGTGIRWQKISHNFRLS